MGTTPDPTYDPEDSEDRRELDAALAEDDFVPWEDAKAALGFSDPTQENSAMLAQPLHDGGRTGRWP